MCEDVLVKVDRMSMAHSLEVRSPLLSKKVIEKAFTIPANIKISSRQTKALLRKLLEPHLPKSITKLPKRGFHIPLDEWLRNDWKNAFEEIVMNSQSESLVPFQKDKLKQVWTQHLNGMGMHGPLLWNIFFLLSWQQHLAEKPNPSHYPLKLYR
jgi:asparagine synthase (glutamine-hydrolysing)